MPPDRVQVDATVVEEELVLRVPRPAFQQRHEVVAVDDSGEGGEAEGGEPGALASRISRQIEEEAEKAQGADGGGRGQTSTSSLHIVPYFTRKTKQSRTYDTSSKVVGEGRRWKCYSETWQDSMNDDHGFEHRFKTNCTAHGYTHPHTSPAHTALNHQSLQRLFKNSQKNAAQCITHA